MSELACLFQLRQMLLRTWPHEARNDALNLRESWCPSWLCCCYDVMEQEGRTYGSAVSLVYLKVPGLWPTTSQIFGRIRWCKLMLMAKTVQRFMFSFFHGCWGLCVHASAPSHTACPINDESLSRTVTVICHLYLVCLSGFDFLLMQDVSLHLPKFYPIKSLLERLKVALSLFRADLSTSLFETEYVTIIVVLVSWGFAASLLGCYLTRPCLSMLSYFMLRFTRLWLSLLRAPYIHLKLGSSLHLTLRVQIYLTNWRICRSISTKNIRGTKASKVRWTEVVAATWLTFGWLIRRGGGVKGGKNICSVQLWQQW